MTDVELNNLSLDSTKEILMDILSLQDNTSSTKQMLMNMLSSRKEDVTKLSELCYERL
jgi:hypothetical protein